MSIKKFKEGKLIKEYSIPNKRLESIIKILDENKINVLMYNCDPQMNTADLRIEFLEEN